MKKIARKTMRLARGTALTLGVAVMVALVLGVATTALAGTGVGARFQLGQTNTVNAITKLVGSVAGPSLQIDNNSADANATALDLQVEAGKAPMKVNSDAQVANLNADKLDGKSANEIGVTGLERVSASSPANSDSPKDVQVSCPPGKVVVGTGSSIDGGTSGTAPNAEGHIAIDDVVALSDSTAGAGAFEADPTADPWRVRVHAICATAP